MFVCCFRWEMDSVSTVNVCQTHVHLHLFLNTANDLVSVWSLVLCHFHTDVSC